jgi:phosphoserine phosphatase
MRTRRTLLASYPPLSLWPTVNTEALSKQEAQRYVSRKEAMQLYFADEPVERIARQTGLNRYDLARMARKCLKLAPDGAIMASEL